MALHCAHSHLPQYGMRRLGQMNWHETADWEPDVAYASALPASMYLKLDARAVMYVT